MYFPDIQHTIYDILIMISFEQFKKKPRIEREIEKKPESLPQSFGGDYGVEKRGEAALQNRNERRIEALENEIREVKNYMAAKIPGYGELERIQERMTVMEPAERRLVLRDFDKRFPGSRREYISSRRDIQKRTEAIQRIQRRVSGKNPFEKAA